MSTKLMKGLAGEGLFTTKSFEPGELIIPLDGIQIREEACPPHLQNIALGDPSGVCTVPEDESQLGWWKANHSCTPNAALLPIGLMATRRVPAESEITVWYAWMGGPNIPCLCGAELCYGTINVRLDESPIPLILLSATNNNFMALEALSSHKLVPIHFIDVIILGSQGEEKLKTMKRLSREYGVMLKRSRLRYSGEWKKAKDKGLSTDSWGD